MSSHCVAWVHLSFFDNSIDLPLHYALCASRATSQAVLLCPILITTASFDNMRRVCMPPSFHDARSTTNQSTTPTLMPFRHINRDAARTHGLSNITPTIDCLVKSCRSTRYHTTFHPNFPSRSRRTFGGTSLKLTWRSRYATWWSYFRIALVFSPRQALLFVTLGILSLTRKSSGTLSRRRRVGMLGSFARHQPQWTLLSLSSMILHLLYVRHALLLRTHAARAMFPRARLLDVISLRL